MPVAPVAPVSPRGPGTPCIPCAPATPCGPMGPWAPAGPVGPVPPSPGGPVGPGSPRSPAGPVAPRFTAVARTLESFARSSIWLSEVASKVSRTLWLTSKTSSSEAPVEPGIIPRAYWIFSPSALMICESPTSSKAMEAIICEITSSRSIGSGKSGNCGIDICKFRLSVAISVFFIIFVCFADVHAVRMGCFLPRHHFVRSGILMQ